MSASQQRLPLSIELASPLDEIDAPKSDARVLLSSGRSYELSAGESEDHLVVRGRDREVVLRVRITDEGPILSFESAALSLSATRSIDLDASSIRMKARQDMELEAGGDLRQRVKGHHHVSAEGDARVEATNVEVQASRGRVELLAEGRVSIDGEHIGLNDKSEPQPFDWSRAATDDE